MAIITEHFAGKWPFWLSPRQVLVVPVAVPYVSHRGSLRLRVPARSLTS